MKPYPAYKPSGVEWIGEIPEHWEVKKLKHFSKIVLGKMLTPQDKGNFSKKPYLRAQNVLWEKVDATDIKEMWFSENELIQFRLNVKDLLVCEGGEVGRTAIWKNELEECYIQNSVHKVTLIENYDPVYFLYCFLLYGQLGHFDAIVNKVSIGHLTREKLKEIYCMAPTSLEQQSIAAFLDRKTHRIDTLIEKEQRQIERLKEQRSAVINQAVTKGLDPDVQMKDSGIEWLEEKPEHWEVKKLKMVLTEKLKYGANESAELDDENLPRYIRITDFDDMGKLRTETFKSLPYDIAKEYLLKNGDVLFARSGATVGKTFQFKNYDGEACFAGYLIKATVDEEIIISDYLYYYTKTNSYENWKDSIFIKATIQNISADKYSILDLPIPPVSEQQSITTFLDRKTNQIDILIEKKHRQIGIFKEYRTALISEAVTGKINVRSQ
ncbi:MAG TPA: restriction endonuclease subunit S [archaeon]|nr:restriction endonuclease subunit S [archaeon]